MPLVKKATTDNISVDSKIVWNLLSEDFLKVSDWAGGVNSSGPNPNAKDAPKEAPHAGRICDIEGMGETDERVVEYDSKGMVIAYTISAKKIPFFVKEMKSRWIVERVDENNSKVTLEVSALTKGPVGFIGQFPLAKMLQGASSGLLGDLKKHLEK